MESISHSSRRIVQPVTNMQPNQSQRPRNIEDTPWPERIDWEILGPDFVAAWGYPRGEFQPEHIEILGPTRGGKTYFQAVILKMRAKARRSHIVVLATKPADATISAMGWPIVTKWPPPDQRKYEQVIYWAKRPSPDDDGIEQQRTMVKRLLNELFEPSANVILVWDEIAYVEQVLKLESYVTMYMREGAGLGITNVLNTQRGARVSRYVHSESSWTVCFRPKDADDAKRIAEILGDRQHYMQVLNTLDSVKREFLIVHSLTQESYISHIPKGTLTGIEKAKEQATRRRIFV